MARAEEGELVGGRYRLLRGAGQRWRARDEINGEQVSLERVRVRSAQDASDRVARFEQDRGEHAQHRTVALRKAPNLVFADHLLADEDVVWSVSRLVEGRTLAEDIATYGPAAATTVEPIARDLLRALSAAHSEGITHGSLSPAAVRLTGTGEALLTGFDVPVDDSSYHPPEGRDPSPAGDVHALGSTLLHALEGRSPGHSGTPAHGGELGQLIARMRAADPAQRPSADEAWGLVEAPADRVVAPRPESEVPADQAPYRLFPVVGVVVAIGLLLLVTVGLIQLEDSGTSSYDSDGVSTSDSTSSDESSEDGDESYYWDSDESDYWDESGTTTTTTSDSTEEAFDDVQEGSCLPIYQSGDGEWNTSVPPDPVPCDHDTAGVFLVISTTLDSTDCRSESEDHVPWSYTGDSGDTTTLCLDRVWVPRYCVLAELTGDDGVRIGTSTAVDCDETELPSDYNTVLVVDSVKTDPTAPCARSSSDTARYYSLTADEGSSLVCFTFPS
ncbi:hypothetical protein EIL87_18325 [Saccharopolyspora rhizosphaerae]|uniref:non-specific serine/threonine protein kinase n=1 Tax=Saccharopolyspora rhizosphaerae TaxID=2492662 RepID=A0A3R8VCF8_9PSEU|nr:hypothetical protein [Saccharopolyspora rhizosphaerae]RRO14704.1 hypothetical protein EIL87_18325 [Saccharopolyspora rhizosphaerae]